MSGGGLFSDSGMMGNMFGGIQNSTGINLSGIPFLGGLFPDPNQKAMRDALNSASSMMGNQRVQQAAGYQNLANNALGALQPAQNALSQMYGGTGQMGPTPPGGFQPGWLPQQQAPQQSSGGGSGDMLGGILGGILGGGGGGMPGLGGGIMPGMFGQGSKGSFSPLGLLGGLFGGGG